MQPALFELLLLLSFFYIYAKRNAFLTVTKKPTTTTTTAYIMKNSKRMVLNLYIRMWLWLRQIYLNVHVFEYTVCIFAYLYCTYEWKWHEYWVENNFWNVPNVTLLCIFYWVLILIISYMVNISIYVSFLRKFTNCIKF